MTEDEFRTGQSVDEQIGTQAGEPVAPESAATAGAAANDTQAEATVAPADSTASTEASVPQSDADAGVGAVSASPEEKVDAQVASQNASAATSLVGDLEAVVGAVEKLAEDTYEEAKETLIGEIA